VTNSEEIIANEKVTDPRILRTRKLLGDAMVALIESQPFDTISISEICEQATVNRTTFYAHYADREALLEDVVQNRFDELLEVRQVTFDGTCPSALRVVIQAVYDFLAEMGTGCRKQQRHFEPFVQSVVQARVEQVLRIGLEKGAFNLKQSPNLVAAALSWAIYGAALSALRGRNNENTGAAISALRDPGPVNGKDTSGRFVDDVYALLLPLLVPNGVGAAHPEAHPQ
jgi:AcrR family transcriptional regulator